MPFDSKSSPASAGTAGAAVPSRQPPAWRSLGDARQAVDAALRAFLSDLDRVDADGRRSALALRVTVGVGKSATLRAVLVDVAPAILKTGHILVYVPTHALAEEAAAAFRSLGTGIPTMVLRGRDAVDPATGTPMCRKSELARDVAKMGGGVSAALCQAKDPATGKVRQAPCRAGCAWYAQLPGEGVHRIVFLPHAYLAARIPPAIGKRVALRVIDEKCLGVIARTRSVYVDDWLVACSCPPAAAGSAAGCLHEARHVVHEALLRRQPIVAALRTAGCTREQLRAFEIRETADRPQLDVTPWMAESAQQQAVAGFDFAGLFRARARAQLWRMLHAEWLQETTERLSLAHEPSKSGPPRAVIRLHSCGIIPRDAPLILLDADADPVVTESLAPGTEFLSIDVRPNAAIVQVDDRTFSNAALLSRPGAAERRHELLDLVRREVERAEHGVLLVATKDVLRQLHQDADPTRAVSTDEDLMRPLLGARPRWFGPGMQGVDAYKAFDAAIVVGRLQPQIDVIEDQMRAVFGNGGEPLALLPPDDPTRGWYAEARSTYLMADDTLRAATIRGHPDPRGAAILAQHREAATLQAIGRIRAVMPGPPKRILILCSLPLPGLPVDRLVLWQELVTGRSRGELSAKSRRLEAALYRDGGQWPVTGLRLSASGIAQDAPEVFPARTSAAEWRRGLAAEAIRDMIRTIARRRVGRPVFIELRRPGGGKRIPAVLFDQPDPADAVARHWPGLELASTTDRGPERKRARGKRAESRPDE